MGRTTRFLSIGDSLGNLVLNSRNSSDNVRLYNYLRGKPEDVVICSENGRLDFLIANITNGYGTVIGFKSNSNVQVKSTTYSGEQIMPKVLISRKIKKAALGSVLIINVNNPGKSITSTKPYDIEVAGILTSD